MEGSFQREDENVGGSQIRARRVKLVKNPISCEIDFDGTLTSEACCKLVVETIKYVLYNRGQLPLQYDVLFKLYLTDDDDDVDGKRNVDNYPGSARPSFQFRKMKRTVENIKELLDRVDYLFQKNDTCEIQEFLIIIGGTPVSPKSTYNIKLPKSAHETFGSACTIRRSLVQMFRKLVMMEELSGLPVICPTNTHIFVKMRRTTDEKWFVPKPNFQPLTSRGLWVLFIFRENNEMCAQIEPVSKQVDNATIPVNLHQNGTFEIFADSKMQSASEQDSSPGGCPQLPPCRKSDTSDLVNNVTSDLGQLHLVTDALTSNSNDDEEAFIWFQAPIVIKGVVGTSAESGTNWM